ncbi:hypothetical protein EZV76_00420 [Flagellimonas alvinocaridis]|uniref:SEC-C domain-containing protein n=1 Tax=Flagellimonas alvinocaridis TaxID=2530200 RepID=A0A4S8RZE3_9FLAO|nr:hypothetical protein [Allomuricauda alvinocaridis]THV60839.1 hypothetical protein EZV76_00420 [Allomuricauda alvinocaridis]
MPISHEINAVLTNYSGLKQINENLVCGTIGLSDGDSYEIEANLSQYPKFFPSVKEVGGRIPVKMDRHVYPSSGNCCFTTRAKSQILLKTKVKSLLQFFDWILVPFFENNSFYEIHSHYFGEEYSHGENGIIESYKDILKIDDTLITAKTMIQATKSKFFKEHQNCYCGSGRRLRKCANGKHINYLRHLYLVDKDVIQSDLNSFKDSIDEFLESRQGY